MAINAINLKSVRVAGNLDEINSKQFIMRSHLQNLHVSHGPPPSPSKCHVPCCTPFAQCSFWYLLLGVITVIIQYDWGLHVDVCMWFFNDCLEQSDFAYFWMIKCPYEGYGYGIIMDSPDSSSGLKLIVHGQRGQVAKLQTLFVHLSDLIRIT